MPLDFYCSPSSPPGRAVLLGARAAAVPLNVHVVHKRDAKKPEFLEKNPQQTVPFLVDDGLCLNESRVILSYLTDQYAASDELYPKNNRKRAVVDLRMHFDLGTLMPRASAVYRTVLFEKKPADLSNVQKLEEALSWLDGFLSKSKWVAGDHMTIADCSIVAGVSTVEITGLDLKKYTNISRWLTLCKSSMPGYVEINQAGVDNFVKK